MQLQPALVPKEGADGWQVNNPPVLASASALAALLASATGTLRRSSAATSDFDVAEFRPLAD
jgi:hypothetical protein